MALRSSGAAPTIEPGNVLLSLQHIVYRREGVELLRDISFDLDTRSLSLVLGANGAGKTLLLRLCHGMITPSSGVIQWHAGDDSQSGVGGEHGRDLKGVKNASPRQTMVFQKPVMLRRSVLDNVSYRLAQQSKSDAREQAWEALRWAGLEHLAKRSAMILSGGEQQQLALARAWSVRPQVLFLDEPTANLDPGANERIEGLIGVIRQNGVKIVMSTHNLAQAQRLADDVIFMHQGGIDCHQQGSAFFSAPASEAARQFISREGLHL